MIRKNDLVADPKDDYAGALLRRYERGKSRRRRAELAGIVKALRLVLQRSGYIEFRGHHDRYHLLHVGDSYLYHVPENKRGYVSTIFSRAELRTPGALAGRLRFFRRRRFSSALVRPLAARGRPSHQSAAHSGIVWLRTLLERRRYSLGAHRPSPI